MRWYFGTGDKSPYQPRCNKCKPFQSPKRSEWQCTEIRSCKKFFGWFAQPTNHVQVRIKENTVSIYEINILPTFIQLFDCSHFTIILSFNTGIFLNLGFTHCLNFKENPHPWLNYTSFWIYFDLIQHMPMTVREIYLDEHHYIRVIFLFCLVPIYKSYNYHELFKTICRCVTDMCYT